MEKVVMENVREYAEEMPVEIRRFEGRLVIHAANEGGLNCTEVDLQDVLDWVMKNGDGGVE